ncbi:unnamed protein product, partial [Brassica oleracea]
GQAAVKLRFRGSLCQLRRPPGLPFSFAFLCSSLSVGPRRSAASKAGPSFSSGVDLERSLHQSQAVGLCSARGRCSLLTGSVSSTGGRLFPDEVFPVSTCLGLSYGVWRFGEARVVRVVLHRLVSRRWWTCVGVTVLVSPTPAFPVATCVDTAARVAARDAGQI